MPFVLPIRPDGPFNAALLAQQLHESGTEIVFLLGLSAAAKVLFHEAHRLDWQPIFLIPGALASQGLFDAPPSLNGRIFLSFPTSPADHTPAGMAAYRRLAAAYRLPPQHLATQLSALASAQILIEGFKRAGRDASRAKLLEALEGLYEFQTGIIPAVTYGPNRRVGALGAYIVAVDLAAKTFVPVSAWIEPN